MDRRSFLFGTGSLLISQLLVGCGGKNQTRLNIRLLKNSIPSQIVNQFGKNLQPQAQLQFAPVAQLQGLFKQLQTWQQEKLTPAKNQGWRLPPIPLISPEKPTVADLVTLGDYWIGPAIEQKLIQPLAETQLKQWPTLNEKWKKLVTRNDKGLPDAQGKVWAAPYRWGATVIVYNRDKFQKLGWAPKDWSDLWRDELQQRISLFNQPREVIGLTLKKLGESYNTENLDKVPNLEKELRSFNQQVKLYSSNSYLEPLIIKDTWLAVGWSSDIVPILASYPELAVVIPQSGTALWADLWVRPAGVANSPLPYQWIDFCWQPDIAQEISVLTKSNSPIPTNLAKSEISEVLRNLLQSNSEVFNKSEFLLPLSQSTAEQYKSLFEKIKV